MERLKLVIILFFLTITAGMALKSPSFMPFGLGLSLFIPGILIKSLKENGLPLALLSAISPAVILLLANRESFFDITSILALGILFYALRKSKPSTAVTLGGVFLTLTTILEEKLFGLPKELIQFKEIIDYRFGIYFFSSVLFSFLSYGISNLFSGELKPLNKLKFGFWLVILFMISAIGVLSNLKIPYSKFLFGNILVVSLSLISLQGLTVSLWFWSKLSTLPKLITGVSIIIFPAVIFIASAFLGLLDYIVNFRKSTGGEENEGSTD